MLMIVIRSQMRRKETICFYDNCQKHKWIAISKL